MDSYTAETQKWLDDRYRVTTDDGIFFAHQNIYGFQSRTLSTSLQGKRSAYAEEGAVLRYLIFWNIVKALKLLQFDSVLDVGGAEGYMSAVFRQLFGARVRSCDLSAEACKRAQEIFAVEADTVDGVSLPYPDSSFDVVVCSESLEHIPDYELVLHELLRVARKAVVITVPHEGSEAVARNIREKIPHGHIHDFTLKSFRDIVPASCSVEAVGLNSSLLRLPFRLAEGTPVNPQSRQGFKRPLVKLLNALIPVCRPFRSEAALNLLFKLDALLATSLGTYRGVLFILAKDPSAYRTGPAPKIDLDAVLNFKVPLHRLS
jgi:SAM-dependent methyltransferase